MIKPKPILFCLFFLTMLLLSPTRVFADLPPRPIPPAKPQGESNPVIYTEGAKIVLILPVEDHPTVTQATWTTVEWEDEFGIWHQVDGWAGTPTFNTKSQEWEVEWWVDVEHFSAGPFRWVVDETSQSPARKKITTPFHLPGAKDVVKIVTLD